MPAVIKVENGDDKGLLFPIEKEFFRIGSAENCPLRLKDAAVPAFLAMVEYQARQHHYLLINKASEPLLINGLPLAPGAHSVWSANQTVQFKGQLVLRLQIEGDPAPSRRTTSTSNAELGTDKELATTAQAVEQSAAPAREGSKAAQIAVIAFLGVIIVLLLLFKITSPAASGTTVAEPVSFGKLTDDLRKQTGRREGEAKTMLLLLQEARMAERRGHVNTANRLYQRALLVLRDWQQEDGSFQDDSQDKVFERSWKFALQQLQ